MDSKYTEGEWEVTQPTIRGMRSAVVSHGEKDLIVCHVDDVDGFSGNSKANAQLLAAAPELYEALKEVLALLPQNQDALIEWGLDSWIYSARCAISKAEGKE